MISLAVFLVCVGSQAKSSTSQAFLEDGMDRSGSFLRLMAWVVTLFHVFRAIRVVVVMVLSSNDAKNTVNGGAVFCCCRRG